MSPGPECPGPRVRARRGDRGQCAVSLQLYSVTPVLMVIATAQLVALFTPRQLLLILGPANLGAYCIARFLWLGDQPLLFTLSYLSFQLFAGMMTWYALKSERTSL